MPTLIKLTPKLVDRLSQVTLWDGDALQLCTTRLASHTFDAIDTSNLADHVGLLNLLVCAGPRLVPSPLSRLNTETMLWQTVAEDLPTYLKFAVGPVSPAFFPTILGLRLLTDFELGRPRQGDITDRIFRQKSNARLIQWGPASTVSHDTGGGTAVRPGLTEAVPGRPQTDGPGDLGEAVQAVVARCMVPSYATGIYKTVTSGFGEATTMTLAYLLAACVGTPAWTPAGCDGTGSDAPTPVHLPKIFRLGWRAALACVAAGATPRVTEDVTSAVNAPGESLPREASASAAHPETPATAPAAVADGDAVAYARGRDIPGPTDAAVPPEPPVMLSAHMTKHPFASVMSMGSQWRVAGRQPALRLVLGETGAAHVVSGSLLVAATPNAVAHHLAESAGLHFIDNVICDVRDDGYDVKFVLPANHGLPLEETTVVLVDINTVVLTTQVPLNQFTSRAVPSSTCRRLHAALCAHPPRILSRPPASATAPEGGPPRPAGNPAAHSASTASPSEALAAHPAPPGRGDGGPTCAGDSVISVVSCVETATGYAVELSVGGEGELSGLSMSPPYEPGGPATHSVKISLARPAGASREIRTVYPVDVGRARLKLSRKQRLITVELPKAEFWPIDVALPGMVPKLCADDLEAGWRQKDLEIALMMMHTNTEMDWARQGFSANWNG